MTPSNLDKDYLWIGKCRKGKKTRGRIGLCVSREISVLDDNLHASRDDHGRSLGSNITEARGLGREAPPQPRSQRHFK